jgi:hypothetical protein
MKWKALLPLLSASCLICCGNHDLRAPDVLLITSDFGSVRQCRTIEDVTGVARIMMSAKPDIVALDATANGLVNYRSEIGFLLPGSNFDALLNAGVEPFRLMVDTLRDHGITVLANVRMNDHHGREIQWTPWEREHKAWSLVKDTGDRDWKSIGALRQMDYAIEGVRKYRLAILEEILTRFNVDGVQLDFGRTAPFLSEPKGENARFMTGYVRAIRHMLEETARKRERGAMVVPWDLDFCSREGLQVQEWIAQGLLDYVSPGEWYYADWNILLDRWRDVVRGTQCRLYPFTPGNVSPYQEFGYGEPSLLGDNRILDPPKIRAIADNLMFQKPDGIAFYNFYTFDFGQYYPDLRTWTNPERTQQMSKQYLYCRRLMYQPNERETFDLGVAFERQMLRDVGDRVELPFRFSTDLSGARATLRCAFKDMGETDDIVVHLNGQMLLPDTIKSITLQSKRNPVSEVRYWECALGAPPLEYGSNVIQWELAKRGGEPSRGIAVGEFEILVNP